MWRTVGNAINLNSRIEETAGHMTGSCPRDYLDFNEPPDIGISEYSHFFNTNAIITYQESQNIYLCIESMFLRLGQVSILQDSHLILKLSHPGLSTPASTQYRIGAYL